MRHQAGRDGGTESADDRVGECNASVTVTEAGKFSCSLDMIPSEFMKGNIEDEADWVELYAVVNTKGIENYTTSPIIVTCNWCNTEELGPKE